jgi:hypothetical protein
MHNLMRPLAIPAAGGLVSALVLFSILTPPLTIGVVSANNDIPTVLYTEASLKSVPFVYGDDDIVVELTIDEQGNMVDYKLPTRSHLDESPDLRRLFESNLLFTKFTPATTFGQPMVGKVRISFRASRIDVKG